MPTMHPCAHAGRPSTGVHGVHAMVVPGTTNILLLARQKALGKDGGPDCPADLVNGDEPGMERQLGGMYDYATGRYHRTDSLESTFCASHSHFTNGTLLVVGGEEPGDGEGHACHVDPRLAREGRDAIRVLDPVQQALTTSPVRMREWRWYPTQITLPDDRVLICFGLHTQWVG